jgi:hypothetical protein
LAPWREERRDLAQVAYITTDTENDATLASILIGLASSAITRQEEMARQHRLDYFGEQQVAVKYFMRLPQADIFRKAQQKLQEMKNLLPNWNSYGAEAPNEASRNRAAETLTLLQDRFFLPTKIVASSEGGVAICFIKDDRYADIEFLNTGETLAVTYRGAEEPDVWSVQNGMMEITIDQIHRHFLG